MSTHSRTQTFALRPAACLSPLFAPDAVYPAIARGHPRSRHPAPRRSLRHFHRAELAPSGKKTDWTGFYGFGGGFDILFSKHFGLRTQADLVYDHLFNDVLKDGRMTVRFSVGPCFNFGGNIAK